MAWELRARKGEPLSEWLRRLGDAYGLDREMRSLLLEVSSTSYLRGADAALSEWEHNGVK